jgi:CDP-diacylglycerol--serine O-phosphatidyltransferase
MIDAPAAAPAAILGVARDRANLVTLPGLVCAVLGIYGALLQQPHLGAALLGLALLADMLDGVVARAEPGRAAYLARAGGRLDALCDVVHGGVLPGILLTAVGGISPFTVLASLALAVCSVIRLSSFSTFGPNADASYKGVPVIFNSLAGCLCVATSGPPATAAVFAAILVLLAILNVSNLRIPKLKGGSLLAFNGLCAGSVGVNLHLWLA